MSHGAPALPERISMNALCRAAAAAGFPVRRQTLAAYIVDDADRRQRTRLCLTPTGYQLDLSEGLVLAREFHVARAEEVQVTATRRSALHERFYKGCWACGGRRHARSRRCPDCGEGSLPSSR